MLSVILNYNLLSKLTTHRYKESSIIPYYESKILICDLSPSDCMYSSQQQHEIRQPGCQDRQIFRQ